MYVIDLVSEERGYRVTYLPGVADARGGVQLFSLCAVAAWLSIQPDFSPPTPTAKTILDAYPGFSARLAQEKANSLGTLTWPSILKSAESIVGAMASA